MDANSNFLKSTASRRHFLDIHSLVFTGIDFVQTLKNPPRMYLRQTFKITNLRLKLMNTKPLLDYFGKPINSERFRKKQF